MDNGAMVSGLLRLMLSRLAETSGAERDRLVEMVIAGLIKDAQPSFAVFIAPGPDEATAALAHIKPVGRA